MPKRPATSADVAKLGGVSRATVSYILNDVPGRHISEATRQRVLAAAETLGYTPNAAAKALRSGRSRLILALVPDWDMGPTFARGMEALNRLLAGKGYLLLIHSHSDTVRSLTSMWAEVRPAVVMVFGELQEQHAQALRSAGIEYTSARMFDYLTGISQLQAEYLWSLGHRRFGYLRPAHHVPREIVDYRLAGVEQFCRDHQLDPPVVGELEYSADGIASIEEQWFQGLEPVTGVVAHTDELAAFLMSAATCTKFSAEGFSLIGTGDRPIANLGVTTVGFDFDLVARFWAENALAVLEDREPDSDLENPGRVVIRQSA